MNTIQHSVTQKQKEAFNKIKAIFFDLDFTLVYELQKVPDEIVELFQKLKAQGYITVIATARFLCEAYAYTDKIEPDYIICDNGAQIINIDANGNHESVYSYPIKKDDFEKLLLRLRTIKPYVSIQHDDEYYYSISPEAREDNLALCLGEVRYSMEKGRTIVHELDDITKYPKAYHGDTNRIFVVDLKDTYNVKQIFSDLHDFSPEVRFTRSSPGRYEFTSTNKGVAVQKLTEMLGLKKDETMSFGDSEADIQLFEATGIGVAMENAIDEAKKKAQFICPDVRKFGVKTFLEQHLFI